MQSSGFVPPLISGACAGFAVDVSLFPLDTIKTRLQSRQGFRKSGGFSGIYKGIGPVVLGSAPGAAMFFVAYDTSKRCLMSSKFMSQHETVSYMISACVAEVVACTVRVPVEVIKQRSQTMANKSSLTILRNTLKHEKFKGLFRGYKSTVLREIPFSLIQFPLWEYAKHSLSKRKGRAVSPWEGAWCGFFSGGFAAAVTTPLDVAKTTIMLAEKRDHAAVGRIFPVLKDIYHRRGARGLFAGVVPRVMWISIGGFIFLGTYDLVSSRYR
uniref:S-adenosylmethionine mitochondrial carrier protein-like n=1 Tax=Styela clava TaxID=7725 RepID=UPI0019398066|nr:S-adenosylmethionine mitochondrial carrier protein-like [Styela clava]XP_039267882.1 S-adenosylmethionine mitochondrial carrier protein-like [Styela clava]